jgi:hypothetical protein
LVTSRHSKHLCFSFQPADRILSEAINVFPFDAHTQFAVLQSRTHESWARLLSSSMKTDLRYAASDCFETFPFPNANPRTPFPTLETIGEKLYQARAKYMVDTDQGLTKTYNALKNRDCTDPRILTLRTLHEDLDRAVLDAYGWTNIEVPPFCPMNEAEEAQLQAFKDEVIDRLFVLNAERAAEEAAAAPAVKKKNARGAKKAPPPAKPSIPPPSARPIAKAKPRPKTDAPKSEPRRAKATPHSSHPPSEAPAKRKNGGSRS